MNSLWQLWPQQFNATECQQIVAAGLKLPGMSGAIGDGSSGRKVDSYRRTRVRWLDRLAPDCQLLYLKMDDIFKRSNNSAFGFDLSYFHEIQFTEYSGTYEGKYDWHEDVSWVKSPQPSSHRKLSMVIQLTDPNEYVGGDLELKAEVSPDKQKLRAQGSVIVFPSFVRHQVTPVTAGLRYSLVSWYEGPHFK